MACLHRNIFKTFHMRTRRFLFIYNMVWLLNNLTCYLWPINGLWNYETLYFSVLLTFTEGAWSTDICNQEKYRHRLTSQSLSVPALWAKSRGNKAGHRTTMRCTRLKQTAARWSLLNWSDHKIQSLISEAAWSSHISQRKPNHHHHHCWTLHFTSLLRWTAPFQSCFFFIQPGSLLQVM